LSFTKLHLVDADGLKNLVYNFLSGLVFLLYRLGDERLVSLPVFFLVCFTALLGQISASLLRLLTGLGAHEFVKLEDVVCLEHTICTSANFVKARLLELFF
jgi:hypothetical protein